MISFRSRSRSLLPGGRGYMNIRTICSIALCLFCSISFGCARGSETTQPAKNPPTNPNRPAAPANTSAAGATAGPAPLSQFRVEWVNHQIPSEMRAGKDYAVTVTVRNAGEQTWPATGVGDKSANMVSVSYHWLPATGDNPVVFEGARTPVPTDIAPGQSFTNNSI